MGKKIFAIVGMPGAGKSEVVRLLAKRGFSYVRLGEETDRGLKEAGLPLTEEHERKYREKLRSDLGMAAYAIKARPHIEKAYSQHTNIVLDGLYSWEEYVYLKKYFPELILICVYTDSQVRYTRLGMRAIRPLSPAMARVREIDEIGKLNKGGPIAIADHLIENNGILSELNEKIEALLQKLDIA